MSDKVLFTYLNDRLVGTLTQGTSGKINFTYSDAHCEDISLSMPYQTTSYGHESCEAYFGGLLPESPEIRNLIARRFGISANNTFSLLEAIGDDCPGAISFYASPQEEKEIHSFQMHGETLTDAVLATRLRELPNKPLLIDIEEVRLSLAGIQSKLAVCLLDGKVTIPAPKVPTSHIIKSSPTYLDGLVHNEYFCMRLAAALGISVAKVELHQAEDQPFLLIERYDRLVGQATPFIARVHQEDFCQALGISSRSKYQNEGGPDYKKCFGVLDATSQPASSRSQFIMIMVFNYLIGNADAHAKNFSLLRTSHSPKLAPFYDLICTRVYEGYSKKMAMSISNHYHFEEIMPRHWEKLCTELGISFTFLKQILNNFSNHLVEIAQNEIGLLKGNGFYHPVLEQVLEYLKMSTTRTKHLFDL